MEKVINATTNSPTAQITTFRISNTILIIGMLAGGATVLLRIPAQTALFVHLGYPLFLMTILGTAKILAAITLMLPGLPLLKVSAYTGTFIVSVCAFISHIIAGDGLPALNPLILLAATLTAYFTNPGIKALREVGAG